MREKVAYAHLKRVWQPNHPGAFLMRVENAAAPGTPDAYACYQGISAWFESKVVAAREEAGVTVYRAHRIQRAQPPWWHQAIAGKVPLYGALTCSDWGAGHVVFIRAEGLVGLAVEGLTESSLKWSTVSLDLIFTPRVRL